MNRLLLIAAALTLAPAAMAADNTPAPAAPGATTPTETVAATPCQKPQLEFDTAGKLKNTKDLQPKVTAYQSCTDAYVAEQKQAVLASEAAAKAHRDAGNDAVQQFNNFAAELSAAQQKK